MMDLARKILDSLSTATVLIDHTFTVVDLNAASEMLFGISAKHAIGTEFSSLFLSAGDLIPQAEESLKTGQPFTEREKKIECEHIRATIDCTITPLFDSSHKHPYVLIEFIQLDRHLRISREEYRLTQHHVTRALVRGLAHEIKNPLGGLRGAAQLLERELDRQPELTEYTQIIIAEADRLQKLMDKMLGPRQLPKMAMVNIHQITEHIFTLVSADLPENITFLKEYDPSIPEIYADSDQLIQALLNIVKNAVDALDGNGCIILRTKIQRQFTINQMRYKLVIRIEIEDNGPGIPPDKIEQIFYPMVTFKDGGSGLGLPIAQSLVAQHKGLIECNSEPGKTLFVMYLPLEPQE